MQANSLFSVPLLLVRLGLGAAAIGVGSARAAKIPDVETMTPARIAAEHEMPDVVVNQGPVPATGDYAIQVLNTLPPYRPRAHLTGTLRIWTRGIHFFGQWAEAWKEGFGRFQPDLKLDIGLYGTSSIVGGVTWGAADVGVQGEEFRPLALEAFEKVNRHPPLTVAIATGSLDVDNMSYAQVFFVHRDNPLQHVTLAQLNALLSAEPPPGMKPIRTWGDLGLTGEWAHHRIHIYAWYNPDFMFYLQNVISGGNHRWRTDITQSKNVRSADGGHMAAVDGLQIMANLSKDRYGIAISSMVFAKPQFAVKPLALAAGDGRRYVPATEETLIRGEYPLTRYIPVIVDRRPGEPLDPKVKEFLRYLLSREGQWDMVRTHRYLPLSRERLELELGKLDAAEGAPYVPAAAPHRSPEEAGTIRIAGDAAMASVVRAWQAGFENVHPEVRVTARLLGTETGMSALYTGNADIALMGRDLTSQEHDGYGYVFTYFALGVDVLNGSLGTPGESHALIPFVRRDNPLSRISVDQLAAIFGAHPPNGGRRIATWDQLGLAGKWVGRPIHGYLYDQNDGAGAEFTRVVLQGSTEWNWAVVKEFKAIPAAHSPDGLAHDADEQIAAALAADPYGIGFTSPLKAAGRIKPLAVSLHDKGPACKATPATIASGAYPLARRITAYLHQPPGRPVDPQMLEFLQFVLSPEGQQAAARSGDFLPLAPQAARLELKRIE
jgi:phosphate transport system substrate-binding protein